FLSGLLALSHLCLFIPSPRPRRPTPPLSPYTTLFRSVISSASARVTSTSRVERSTCSAGSASRSYSARDTTAGGSMPSREVEVRSEEHTSELQSRFELVCRLLLEKKKTHRECRIPQTR